MKSEIQQRLEEFAFNHSKPFCYHCYEEAPSGRCSRCHSDDLMRLVSGVGVEWGIDWVVRHFIEERLTPVDTSAQFEQSIRDTYPEEVKVGWMTLDAVSVMKDMDLVSWKIAQSEWEDVEVSDGNLLSFDNGGSYYSLSDIEQMLDSD